MSDIEEKAWEEALQFAFEQAEINREEWSKSRQFKNYAVRNGKELYPNKIIYGYCLDFLKENYSTLFGVEIGIDTGVGIRLNAYLASKGADTVTINEFGDEHKRFKKLLAYFVSHLEWVVNKNESYVGFESYIKPLINSKSFKNTGQGYAGDKIQDQIKDWDKYDDRDIKINIQASFGNYKTVKSYLNWKGTGINIVARWENNSVISLYQEEYFYMETPKRRVNLGFEITLEKLALFNQNDINENLISFYNSFVENFKKYKNKIKRNNLMNTILKHKNLLEYKKQIILQGPPGTGKTRLAKEIAQEMINSNVSIELNSYLKKGLSIANASGTEDYYLLENITTNSVELSSERATKKWSASFNKIQEKLSQLQRDEIPKNKGGDDPYVLAVAKYIFNKMPTNSDLSENSDQFKLIQFHPNYTYEDFVRGIVAESKGDKIEYKNVNKTLGLFAEEALKNYQKSTKIGGKISKTEWANEQFDNFIEIVQAMIDNTGEYRLTDKVKVVDIDDSAFYYTGDSWLEQTKHRMKFTDIKEALLKSPPDKKEFKALRGISGSAKQHYGYYYKVYSDVKDSITKKYEDISESTVETKNYVLIIDEINRANLSSVLGELIYALEYRGKEVESMYSVDDSLLRNKLIFPPNLYIIGTMNTADRSVGHIDYAIRRRFAFVDVLPKELKDDTIVFHKDIFRKVSELFIENYSDYIADEKIALKRAKTLSEEFRPEDVWLGHSYFFQKKQDDGNLEPQDFRIRIDYEIKPILLEYVKDGILNGKVGDINIEDYIKSL